jgi:hypothetical protein
MFGKQGLSGGAFWFARGARLEKILRETREEREGRTKKKRYGP